MRIKRISNANEMLDSWFAKLNLLFGEAVPGTLAKGKNEQKEEKKNTLHT